MELFNRAAGQLSDARIEVRLAAIYVLREAARDFPEFSDPLFELLQAYLRSSAKDYGDAPPPIDIEEILEILRRRLGST